MRVLALVTDAFGGLGGIARYNRLFLRAFSELPQITEVAVLSVNQSSWQTLPDRICQFPSPRSRAGYVMQALILAFTAHFDFVFCGHLHLAPVAATAAMIKRIPLWLQIHGIESWEIPGKVVRHSASRSALVTSVSRYTRRRFLSWADVPPERVRVLPNSLPPGFGQGPEGRTQLRELGIEGYRVMLTVSRLSSSESYKGHDCLIRVMPDLLKEHPDLMYLIAGDGDGRPGLEFLASELGVENQVRFLGEVNDMEASKLYRSCDLFAMPSWGEGFGIVFLEALACGKPVVAGNRDGSVDALWDGELGVLVNPHAPDEVKQAISKCLQGEIPKKIMDPSVLSRTVRHIYGFDHFKNHVSKILARLPDTSLKDHRICRDVVGSYG